MSAISKASATSSNAPTSVITISDSDGVHLHCLAADLHNLDGRRSFILCHKPQGHDGYHGNEHFTWPAAGIPVEGDTQ